MIVLSQSSGENQLQKATHWGELMLGEIALRVTF